MPARGRPRGFDRDAALRAAMRVFWKHGYQTTAMSDLTAAMGVNSPSVYAAFGSKKALFMEAVALYDAEEGGAAARVMDALPTAREAIAAMLRHYARRYTDPAAPYGCMIVQSAQNTAVGDGEIRDYLAREREKGRQDLRRRLDDAVRDGELSRDTDTDALASFYTAVLQGMSVQARDGAPHARLAGLAECAAAAWDAAAAPHL